MAEIKEAKISDLVLDDTNFNKHTDIDLDSKQGREMALADNATASVDLAWDEEQIQFAEEEFGMVAEEWGVEIDNKEQPTAIEDDFDESTDEVTTQCKKGEVWQLGEHRLMCGDSTSADDVAKLMDGAKADMVFTYTWTKSHHNYRGGEYRTTIWKYDKPRKCDLHPTMKPVEFVANCLKDCTKEGMSVLDVFGGSGTTLIACEQLNRKCFMMELDPYYCDVIIARWEKLTGKNARRITDGI